MYREIPGQIEEGSDQEKERQINARRKLLTSLVGDDWEKARETTGEDALERVRKGKIEEIEQQITDVRFAVADKVNREEREEVGSDEKWEKAAIKKAEEMIQELSARIEEAKGAESEKIERKIKILEAIKKGEISANRFRYG